MENQTHIRYSCMPLDRQLRETTTLGGFEFSLTILIYFYPKDEGKMQFICFEGVRDPNWAFHSIIRFIQFQRERVEREQITGATLRNSLKAIKLFCEMSDVAIAWKKITRGLPKIEDSPMIALLP